MGTRFSPADVDSRALNNRALHLTYENVLPYVVKIEAPLASAGRCGTGFFCGPKGLILTASHVVHDSPSIRVVLGGGERYAAELVGDDPLSDLAALRINLPNKNFARAGRSVRVGDRVVASSVHKEDHGYRTMSVGSVAAVQQRMLPGDGGLCLEHIQADILLRRGSSGGPLTNARGEVVGINCSRDAGGYTLAVPVNTALTILNRWLAERPAPEAAPAALPLEAGADDGPPAEQARSRWNWLGQPPGEPHQPAVYTTKDLRWSRARLFDDEENERPIKYEVEGFEGEYPLGADGGPYFGQR